MKPWWVTWIIPSIQLILLGVQCHFHRKSIKLSRQTWEKVPETIVENGKLWRINRVLVEWVKINHPESYEDFKTICLTENDMKLLQMKESEGGSVEGDD